MWETGKAMPTLVEEIKMLEELHGKSSERKLINSELWHACAGPLVTLPQPGSLVYYFPQGHSEQVTASTKKIANTHIPSYPGLPSQMMCQVHNITLHADKQTDEIYAKMILQPVNSENDVLRIPDFGLTKSKQPTEFFCKTLTPSDTSTHGGFSVPRRAAEKLFPQLDYSIQPPNQELVVKDMHDNTWNFRHIYRGQPKRHLLTTGWSVFVGTKQLKAGDSVLFIRGERSQLMLGIRRANHQQTMPPSSVLSADSMHIGVLAAAAHAAANRSQFTIYYNPRASPSEFVVPLAKYHRAAYGMQVSIGMRFGMMFETECSSKRRYTGTVVGISDSDPFRWPNSKWRNLQVEWDDSGCVERSNRVSLWEIDTPDNRFGFPCATSLKRSHSGILGWESMTRGPYLHTQENILNPNPVVPNLVSHGLMSTYMKPDSLLSIAQTNSEQVVRSRILQNIKQEESWMTSSIVPAFYGAPYQLPPEAGDANIRHISVKNSTREDLEKSNLVKPDLITHSDAQQHDNVEGSLSAVIDNSPNRLVEQSNDISSSIAEKEFRKVIDGKSLESYPQITDQLDEHSQLLPEDGVSMVGSLITEQASSRIPNDIPSVPRDGSFHATQAQQFNTETGGPTHFYTTETDVSDYNSSQYTNAIGWSSCSSFPLDLKPPEYGNGFSNPADISAIMNLDDSVPIKTEEFLLSCETSVVQSPVTFADELFGSQLSNSLRDIPLLDEPLEEHYFSTQNEFTALQNFGLKDFPEDTSSLNELYPSFGFDHGSGGMIGDPSMSCTSHEAFGATCNSTLTFPSSQGIKCKVNSFQDVQSQVTSASLTDFSVQEFHDTCDNTSPSDMAGLGNSLSKRGSRKQSRSLRTYTKVQKLGSVGRSIDVTRFTNYKELRSAIGTMFGLQQQLNDPKASGWKLVYIDYENDVLLVGDDPWEEFIGCVRCIRILSPTEVQRMGNEDTQLRGISFAPKIDQCSVP